MPTPQGIVKSVGTLLQQRHLKELGFKKAAQTWVKAMEWPRVINLQSSSWNSREEARFTLNLGVFVEPLRLATGDLPPKGALKEYDCNPRVRLGRLFPHPYDKWWSVTPDSDAGQLADEVFGDLSVYGLPWFEQFADFSTLARHFSSGRSDFHAALAYHFAGDADAAAESMAKARENASFEFLAKLKRVAAAYSIPISEAP